MVNGEETGNDDDQRKNQRHLPPCQRIPDVERLADADKTLRTDRDHAPELGNTVRASDAWVASAIHSHYEACFFFATIFCSFFSLKTTIPSFYKVQYENSNSTPNFKKKKNLIIPETYQIATAELQFCSHKMKNFVV